MSMRDLEIAIDLVEKSGEGDFAGVKDSGLIDKAEMELGLMFPPTYKRFLKELGCGDIYGKEIYGIVDGDFVNSCVPDGIWLTIDERMKYNLPHHLVIIGDLGEGTSYALDTSKTNPETGECPVVMYSIFGETEQIADDFGAFFLEEITTALEDVED